MKTRGTAFEARSIVAQEVIYRVQKIKARYEAAQPSTWRSHIPTGPQDARFNVTQSSRTIIAEKAKHFEDNNAIAQRIGSVFVDYTVGANGLILIPNSTDQTWNEAAKKYWNQWCVFPDVRSRQNFGTLQGLIAWRWLFDGEIFLLKTRGKSADGRTFPRLQLIEYYLVQTPPDRSRDEGKTIVDGVEIDAAGRPTGYWVKETSSSNTFRFVAAEDIIHVFEPSRPGQYRGMSFFHAAINYLHRLDDLQELEFRAADDAAEKSTFVKTNSGEIPPALVRAGADNFHEEATTPQTTINVEERSAQLQEAIGGRMQALKTGEDVVQFQPTRPTEATRALWSYLTSCVCSAVGIPKVICFSEWLDKMQGTVVRGDYDIADKFFKARSAVLSSAFREVYIYVIGWGIRSELDLADRPGDGSWVNVTIRPPKSVNVDVGRNSSAMLAELAAGATNFDLIYGPLGLDAREELSKSIHFMAWLKKECAAVSQHEGVTVEAAEIVEHAAIVLDRKKAGQTQETQQQQDEELVQ